jgi:pseudaminic acid synthase
VTPPAARSIRIADRDVGSAYPPFVIAEMSGNHNGDLGTAKDIVRAAAAAGASAIKLQTYTADTMTVDVDLPAFRISAGHELWAGANLYRLYQRAATPWEWHESLFDLAGELGMLAFSAPFDASAVDFLEKLDVPCLKIASSEITDLPLVRRAAETGKPVILSSGMASLGEIDAAVRAARETGNEALVVLSCTVSYPASPADSHLRGLPLLADTFDTVVGLSDHTPGIGAAIAAVALGAAVIEKHLVLSRETPGVDAAFSLEPAQLAALVRESHIGWQALGDVRIGPTESEYEGLRFRRSLYVVADVHQGDPVTRDNVRSIRPAGGLPPDTIEVVLGRHFRQDAAKGTALTWDLV